MSFYIGPSLYDHAKIILKNILKILKKIILFFNIDMPQSVLVFAVSLHRDPYFGTFGGVAHPPPEDLKIYIYIYLLFRCV